MDEVEKLIASALNKTCQLDPAPTWLEKEMRAFLEPFIALLFNRSLATGCFYRVQAGGGPSAPEEDQTRCKRLKELQTGLQFIVFVEVIGENRAGQITGLSWW